MDAFAGGASAGGASADGTPAAGVITAIDTSPEMEDIFVTDDSPTVDLSSAVASFTGDTYKMFLKRIQRKKKLKKSCCKCLCYKIKYKIYNSTYFFCNCNFCRFSFFCIYG